MEFSRVLYSSAKSEYNVVYTPDIVYAHRTTGDLMLYVVSPVAPDLPAPAQTWYNPIAQKMKGWQRKNPPKPAKTAQQFPLIVDIPGSGWSGAPGYRHVPYLVQLAKAGYVCAGISYRGTYKDNVVSPAAVQDMKEAIRFLRANAAMFHIDPDRVALLGDSSGGNTAAIAALTDDNDPRFRLGENLDQSTAVLACACIYGPVDLIHLVQDRIDEKKDLRPGEQVWPEGYPFEAMELFQDTYLENTQEKFKAASPQYYIESASTIPPFLYVIGDEDEYIPMAQGLRFCESLRAHGGRAEIIKVCGAGHGRGVWSSEMMKCLISFFDAYLG